MEPAWGVTADGVHGLFTKTREGSRSQGRLAKQHARVDACGSTVEGRASSNPWLAGGVARSRQENSILVTSSAEEDRAGFRCLGTLFSV